MQPRILRYSLLWCLIGAAAMVFLNGSGLTNPAAYHTDLSQAPHWMANHGDSFEEDDLLLRYGEFNESPMQNLIYWIGTAAIDVVLFNKIVGILVFGLTAGLFFGLVTSMAGDQAGHLAAAFYIVFPRATYETGGGFSKGWAIAFVLLAVYVVEKRDWRLLLWSMPLAGLFYPVSPVLMGAIVSIGVLLELKTSPAAAIRACKFLAAASAMAVVPLLYKYLRPPDFAGEMFSPAQMKQMWERGDSTSYTLPLWEEVFAYFEHPFFVFGGFALLMLCAGSGLVWKRSWTALAVGSAIAYHAADLLVPRIYLPDRYSRFSMAVLLVLWFSCNLSRALERVDRRRLRAALGAAAVVIAAASFTETFRPCQGEEEQGLWEDNSWIAPLSAAVAAEPEPILVAGHPYYTADVVIQARRPVLTINRMYHAWFKDYRKAIDERHRAIFSALFARDAAGVNRLAESYGVTHLIVRKQHYQGKSFREGRLFRREYQDFIKRLTTGRGDFVLNPPPQRSVAFEDDNFWLVRLPLG